MAKQRHVNHLSLGLYFWSLRALRLPTALVAPTLVALYPTTTLDYGVSNHGTVALNYGLGT